MNSTCPVCRCRFSRRERGRLFGGGPWTSRAAACPQCGTLLRWTAWAWRLQGPVAVCVLLCVVRSLPGTVRAAAALAALAAATVAVIGLKLEIAPGSSSDTPRPKT